jgi:valyl-tRNA synthetase
VLLAQANQDDLARLAIHETYLARLAGTESIRVLPAGTAAPPSAIAVIGGMRAFVPMAGLIDPQAEVSRLEKRIGKTREEIQRAHTKLSNESFVRNAPADVVAQEQSRVTDFERTLSSLEEQLDRVRQLL